MDLESLRAFLGWCAVFNIGFLLLSTLAVAAAGPLARKLHRVLFPLTDEELSRAYFQYLAQYKLLLLVFNIVPYLVLRFVSFGSGQ